VLQEKKKKKEDSWSFVVLERARWKR